MCASQSVIVKFLYLLGACGEYYNVNVVTGTIISPSYPDNYPINRKCSWTIRAKTGYKIALKINDFDLEDNKVAL